MISPQEATHRAGLQSTWVCICHVRLRNTGALAQCSRTERIWRSGRSKGKHNLPSPRSGVARSYSLLALVCFQSVCHSGGSMLGMAALKSLPGSSSPGHLSAGTCCPLFLVQSHVMGLPLGVMGCMLGIWGLCGEILFHLLSRQRSCGGATQWRGVGVPCLPAGPRPWHPGKAQHVLVGSFGGCSSSAPLSPSRGLASLRPSGWKHSSPAPFPCRGRVRGG